MITVTHSDIAMFLECRRRFTWNYVDDFRAPERRWGALACGNRVHQAIDAFHKTGEHPSVVHQRLASEDEKIMIEQGEPSWALDELYTDIVMGRNCCDAFMAWLEEEGPYDGYKIRSEVMLEAVILDGRAKLMGKADLLLERETDGWLFTDDYKTASPHTRTSLPPTLERSYQHWVYMALSARVHPEQIVGGANYTVIYKTKNPARMTHPMVERFSPPAAHSQAAAKFRQIEQIVSDMLELMERREALGSHVAYPTPHDACRWCEFRHPCLLMDENPLGARAMLDVEFRRGGRHARYG